MAHKACRCWVTGAYSDDELSCGLLPAKTKSPLEKSWQLHASKEKGRTAPSPYPQRHERHNRHGKHRAVMVETNVTTVTTVNNGIALAWAQSPTALELCLS